MHDPRPTIDPQCLCGQPHPCPAHGPFIGDWHPTRATFDHDPLASFADLLWVLRNDIAPHMDTHQQGAA